MDLTADDIASGERGASSAVKSESAAAARGSHILSARNLQTPLYASEGPSSITDREDLLATTTATTVEPRAQNDSPSKGALSDAEFFRSKRRRLNAPSAIDASDAEVASAAEMAQALGNPLIGVGLPSSVPADAVGEPRFPPWIRMFAWARGALLLASDGVSANQEVPPTSAVTHIEASRASVDAAARGLYGNTPSTSILSPNPHPSNAAVHATASAGSLIVTSDPRPSAPNPIGMSMSVFS